MRIWIPALLVAACANDPAYLPYPGNLEAGVDDGDGGTSIARASLAIPIEPETEADAADRAARSTELGVEVPYVKVGDIEVAVEWTIKNLDTENPGTARVQLNGANELFAYDPALVPVLDDEEEIEAPGLEGDVPIALAAGATVSGAFREDQLREASIDLDAITRGNVNPFAATLTVNKNADSIQPMTPYDPTMPDVPQMPMGEPIPREAFRQMVRVDLVFRPDRHMVLEYTVRVRDIRGIVHDDLLAAPMDELATFATTDYAP